jgi:hypothetical protein
MSIIERFVSGVVDLSQGLAKLFTLGMVSIHWSDKYIKRVVDHKTFIHNNLFSMNEISQ